MRKLIFFFLLISFCAFSQKTPATLISENDATTYSAPFRIRNAFNDQILSNVNQRVPVFLDSADITKRIKFYFNGSHPTATTYNVTWPNKSGTVAFLDDISGGVDTTAFWKTQGTSILNEYAEILSNSGDGMLIGSIDYSRYLSMNQFGTELIDTLIRFSSTGPFWQISSGLNQFDFGSNIDRFKMYINIPACSSSVARVHAYYDESGNNTSCAKLKFVSEVTGSWNGMFGDNQTMRFGRMSDVGVLSRGFSTDATGISMVLGSDATGDIPYRNSSGYLTRLAKGSQGTILRAGASVPAYSTFTIPNTISALSTFVADSANVLTEITPAAGQSIRVNAGGTAWEAYTPGSFTASGGTNNYALDIDGDIRMSDNDNSHYYTIAKGALTADRTLTWPSMSANAYIVGINATGLSANRIVYTANGSGFTQTSANLTYNGSLLAVNNQAVFGATSITSGADFDVNGNVIFSGSSRYLNFGTTAGSSGYGIRDNAGAMEYKDSSGSWIAFNTLGGGIGGSVGSTDNAILRADVGSGVVQSSLLSINDSGGLVSSDTTFTVTLSNGSEIGLDGGLKNIVISGTSATLDNTHVGKNVKCTSDSETNLTVSSTIVLEKVMTITQRGNGTVNLLAGSNVVINGKTSTTGQWDMIWLYLIEKSGGISYYIGR